MAQNNTTRALMDSNFSWRLDWMEGQLGAGWICSSFAQDYSARQMLLQTTRRQLCLSHAYCRGIGRPFGSGHLQGRLTVSATERFKNLALVQQESVCFKVESYFRDASQEFRPPGEQVQAHLVSTFHWHVFWRVFIC